MHAQPGDWLVVQGVRVDRLELRGCIIAVGSPPYTVRRPADDHDATVCLGPDAIVLTQAELSARDEQDRERFQRLGALRRAGSGARRVRT
ncbi:MAG TPA: DUF1918 domain-containing protein [Amycolatopsis sp.]|nr:DUF1918 domain-containing protein [Amycolatopsis sp.]